MDMDHCPTCNRKITDHDDEGIETVSGQRYCLDHLPITAYFLPDGIHVD